uniref:RRP15-like protein n=1 Tax=Globodera rostochiensis TaxID=31243 RepID=A0A914HGM4_GLORO
MSNVRKKLEQLQKANKRQRISTAAEDSILNERVPTEQTAQPAADDQQSTRREAMRRIGNLSNSSGVKLSEENFASGTKVIATAKLEDEELLTGYLGPKEHNHGAAPLTTEWRRHMDNLRQVDKQVDIGRAERLQKSTTRKPKYVIKELNVVRILDGSTQTMG